MHCVEFFGTHDFAWILEPDCKPYLVFRETLGTSKKSASLKKAIEETDDFIAGKKSGLDVKPMSITTEAEQTEEDAEFDALFGNSSGKKTPKSSKKRPPTSTDSDDSSTTGSSKPKGKPKKKKRVEDNGMSFDRESSPSLMNHSKRKSDAVSNFLDRPTLDRPASPSLDIGTSSQILRDKDIQPSKLNFGFLGLGIMGSGIVKNLINSGHSITVWNRTAEKRQEFLKAGAREALTPGDVIAESDITFSCISDPQAAKDMVFGNCGVLSEINTTKGYVEMTGIDADTDFSTLDTTALSDELAAQLDELNQCFSDPDLQDYINQL